MKLLMIVIRFERSILISRGSWNVENLRSRRSRIMSVRLSSRSTSNVIPVVLMRSIHPGLYSIRMNKALDSINSQNAQPNDFS